jgi:hypothetical protein
MQGEHQILLCGSLAWEFEELGVDAGVEEGGDATKAALAVAPVGDAARAGA